MQKLGHILKESVEVVARGLLRTITGSLPRELVPIIEQVHDIGYSVLPDFWSQALCASVRQIVDANIDGDTPCGRWTDDLASDQRLYFAERLGGDLDGFFRNSKIRTMRKHYTGLSSGESLLLVNRLQFVPGNKGSGGGWHRDSPHRSQFKALMYLSDVGPDSGPFEYLDGSHKAAESVRLLIAGAVEPNQYRFANEEVERMIAAGAKRTTFLANAGTCLVVDTKGIHRGKPIGAGRRYAATHYYWDGKIPPHMIESLKPGTLAAVAAGTA